MDVIVRLGPQAVPVQIDLVETADRLQGRLQILIDPPLYFAFRLKETEKDQYTFYTRSPATKLRITVSADTVSGTLSRPGNRTTTLQGTVRKKTSVISDLAATFSRVPFQPTVFRRPIREKSSRPLPRSTRCSTSRGSGKTLGRIPSWSRCGMERTGAHRPKCSSRSKTVTGRPPSLLMGNTSSSLPPAYGRRPMPALPCTRCGECLERVNEPGTPHPIPLTEPVNNYQPTITSNGPLYFTSERADDHLGQDLYRATPEGNGYSALENLGADRQVRGRNEECRRASRPGSHLQQFNAARRTPRERGPVR